MDSRYPPPTDLTPVDGAEMFFNCLEGAILVIAIAWAIRKSQPLLIAVLVGCALGGFVEPLVDTGSRLWFSEDMHVPFTIYDRTYAVFFSLGYAVYYGLGSWLVMRAMESRNKVNLMRWAVFGMLFDAAVEFPWLMTDLYDYYGPQPYELFGFPLYWAPVNTGFLFVTAYACYALRDWLKGPRVLLGALIPIVALGTVYGLAWPTWVVMNTAAPEWAMWVAATISMALSFALIWGIAILVEKFGSPPMRPVPADGEPVAARRETEPQVLQA